MHVCIISSLDCADFNARCRLEGDSLFFRALSCSLSFSLAATVDGFLVITADILGYNYQRHERAAPEQKACIAARHEVPAMVNVA